MPFLRLTVADHEQEGFVHLARWARTDRASAMKTIDRVMDLIDADAEPDRVEAPFWFILDLVEADGFSQEYEGPKMLPTQIASRLAPEQVARWLRDRPDPDSYSLTNREPLLPGQPD